MRAPRIGITTYGKDERQRFSLPAAYVASVRRAGGVPVLLPPGEPRAEVVLELVDGLILAGGGDIDARHYGGRGHAENYSIDAERDASELALARAVVGATTPVLGVCRGAQVLNVALGGSLIEHLPDAVGERVLHRSAERTPVRHRVRVTAGSRLSAVLGAECLDAASWHHQGIDRVAAGFDVVGRADDGTVEAIEMKAHPWLVAVQWHPELTAGEDQAQHRLFVGLVDAARRRPGGERCD